MKRLALLGSTGSIGTNTLDVLADCPDRFELVSLSAGRNVALLLEQVKRFRPKRVYIAEDASDVVSELRALGTEVELGQEGLEILATDPDVDLVVNGLVAGLGLRPTVAAIRAGKDVAIANKETLVVAGQVVTELATDRGIQLIPLDSELTPLWQALEKVSPSKVSRIILPASGGPFFDATFESMVSVTPEEALNHPTWKMGPKITVDSATLMNKGFEVSEATWLLGLPETKIDVVIHRQSIIHCLIEYLDGSLQAHMSMPDMRLPNQQALTHPETLPSRAAPLDLVSVGTLSFHEPDLERFPCLALSYEAAQEGGTAPAVLNAANEIGVYSFLDGRIGFMDVPSVVRKALDAHSNGVDCDLDAIFEADRWGREKAEGIVKTISR